MPYLLVLFSRVSLNKCCPSDANFPKCSAGTEPVRTYSICTVVYCDPSVTLAYNLLKVVLPELVHHYLPPHSDNLTGWLADSELVAQWHRLVPGFSSPTAATCCVDAKHNILLIDSDFSSDVDDGRRHLPAGSLIMGCHGAEAVSAGDFVNAAGRVCGEDGGLTVVIYPISLPSGETDRVTVVLSARDPLFMTWCMEGRATWLGRGPKTLTPPP